LVVDSIPLSILWGRELEVGNVVKDFEAELLDSEADGMNDAKNRLAQMKPTGLRSRFPAKIVGTLTNRKSRVL
jgi:hypothetical protein